MYRGGRVNSFSPITYSTVSPDWLSMRNSIAWDFGRPNIWTA
jgi:hypothetical protein